MYLDGALQGTTDCFLDYARNEKDVRGEEDVWHAFGLAKGKHVVRIVVKGEPFKNSTDCWVVLSGPVLFDDGAADPTR